MYPARVATLLANMATQLRPGEYVFCSLPPGQEVPKSGVLASVVEPEGLSIVISREQADAAGWEYDYVAGWITLGVQSALDAVGLTAAVSSVLADSGVSCNVIAGFHHDHLLIPADRAREALTILQRLSRRARLP